MGIIYINQGQSEEAQANFTQAEKLIQLNSGRNLLSAADYAQYIVWLALGQKAVNAFDQWQAYLLEFHFTPNNLKQIIRLLQLLLDAPASPPATKAVLSLATTKLEITQQLDTSAE
ncbi:MAG: hypothetical protein HYR94_04320 [Chloroflexi bacterium]|nr:hypothetical protein [Chloroflexota bacterium]